MSVRQEKNIKKLPKDKRSWYYDVYYTDIYGKRREKKSMYYKSMKEAKNAEKDFLDGLKQNNTFDTHITGEELVKEWLEYKATRVKSPTYCNIELYVNKYMMEFFCAFNDIHKIKITNVQQWVNNLKNADVSVNHKNKLISYFTEILLYGVNNYDFDNKIINKIYPFRNETKAQKINDAEWNYWTPDQWNSFIAIVSNNYDALIFNFLYYTGIRIGECAGLIWKNVDLDHSRIKIVQQATYKVKQKGYAIIDPKTTNSIRVIDLPNKLVELLRKHYEQESKIYGFNDDFFVFGGIKPLAQTTLRRHLDKYCTLADIKHITVHGFRHSHVSLLIHLGCDSRDVAERIGDTVQTVERVYYHMFPEKKKKTVELLNKL